MMFDAFNAFMSMPQMFTMPDQPSRKKRQNGRPKQGTRRAPFSADGPVWDRMQTAVVVENIPEENFHEDEVRGFFSQFGKIEDVSMRPYKHLAIVKYDNWEAANAAYMSPKVIFDNRFVKVYWYKDEASLPKTLGASNSSQNGTPGIMSNGLDSGAGSVAEAEPEFDLEEFLQRQEEAQKFHEEKQKKRAELEVRRKELERRHKDLLAKQQEEKQRLIAKIASSE